jgi:D-sedoheptulose 7-phosphate isomerase
MPSSDYSQKLAEKIRRAKHVFLIGNGGSHANAEHVANDLIACGIKAFTCNAATLTASANDYGYVQSFARWLRTVATKEDLLIAFSGSGRSPNIVEALLAANEMGMETHLVTDYLRTRDMQQSEEDQLVLGHELMRLLKDSAPTSSRS